MPPAPLPNSPKELYQFGLTPRSERLPIASGGSWVFFSGMFSGGGSGMLERVAILRYGANGKIENLMPEVTQTELADRAMWKVPDVSSYPVFVRADYVWGKGESHFEAHLFDVDAWVFDPATNQYKKRLSYRTTKRYDRGEAGPCADFRACRDSAAPRGQQVARGRWRTGKPSRCTTGFGGSGGPFNAGVARETLRCASRKSPCTPRAAPRRADPAPASANRRRG